jgi:two-component system cell cycle sensor histidine kinase/response regulator CckA
VYGIVQQVRGTIEVDTAPDAGTSFRITMPATTEELAQRTLSPTLKASARGLESILLVEDEAIVRTLVRTVLTEQGYKVVEAADPKEALAICAGGSSFDLLFTDVVMPGMNGHELAKRLVAGQPGMRVLFSSGYSNDTGGLAGKLDPDAFLQKPYALGELASKVRELLDTPLVAA